MSACPHPDTHRCPACVGALPRHGDPRSPYSSALEFLIPQVLDVGAHHDELYGWRGSRVTVRHDTVDLYEVSWSALFGDRSILARGGNLGTALRRLLDKLHRRVAKAVEEEGKEVSDVG